MPTRRDPITMPWPRPGSGNPYQPQSLLGTQFGPNGGGEGDGLSGDGTHLAASSRWRHDMPSYDMRLHAVAYWNGRMNHAGAGEVAGPNAINVKAAWEPEGAAATVPLYVGADRLLVYASDDVKWHRPRAEVIVPGGSLPFSRQFVSVDVALQQWPVNRIARGLDLNESDNQFGTSAGTDQVDAVGVFGTPVNTWSFGPSAIIGTPADGMRRSSILLIQDSIGSFSGEDASPGYGDFRGAAGYIERYLGNLFAVSNAARASSRLEWVAQGFAKVYALTAPYITHLVLETSTNDWSTGRTLPQIQADIATILAPYQAQGVKCILCTSTPKVTATADAYLDGGTTAAANNSVREALNVWIRAKPLGIHGVIDGVQYIEDPARPGRFLPSNPALTNDGTHLTATGRALAQQGVNLNLFA
jgi:hypothetical protein